MAVAFLFGYRDLTAASLNGRLPPGCRSIRKHKLTDEEQDVVNAYERRGIIGAVVVGTGVAGLTTWACTRLAELVLLAQVAKGARSGLWLADFGGGQWTATPSRNAATIGRQRSSAG